MSRRRSHGGVLPSAALRTTAIRLFASPGRGPTEEAIRTRSTGRRRHSSRSPMLQPNPPHDAGGERARAPSGQANEGRGGPGPTPSPGRVRVSRAVRGRCALPGRAGWPARRRCGGQPSSGLAGALDEDDVGGGQAALGLVAGGGAVGGAGALGQGGQAEVADGPLSHGCPGDETAGGALPAPRTRREDAAKTPPHQETGDSTGARGRGRLRRAAPQAGGRGWRAALPPSPPGRTRRERPRGGRQLLRPPETSLRDPRPAGAARRGTWSQSNHKVTTLEGGRIEPARPGRVIPTRSGRHL